MTSPDEAAGSPPAAEPPRPDRSRLPGRRPAAGWLGLLLGGCGLVLFGLLRAGYLLTGEVHLLPALVIVGTSIIPVGFSAWLWGRYPPALGGRKAPTVGALVGTGLAGGAAALALAGMVEYAALGDGSVSFVTIGGIEEIAKLIPAMAFVLWYARGPADTGLVRAALLIGLAVGAGFAVLETLGYAYAAAVDEAASLRTIDELLLLRGIFSPATHLTWTAIATAAAAGLVLAVRRRRRIVLASAVFAGSLLAVIGMHAVWDGFETVPAHVGVAVLGLTALVLVDARLGSARGGP